jgi:hypothetical protein
VDAEVANQRLEQALAFAKETAGTFRVVADDEAITFTAEARDVRGDTRVLVGHEPAVITLRARGVGKPVLDVSVSTYLTADRSEKYLKVVKSAFRVLPHGDSLPLFRYEFDPAYVRRGKVPAAHVQMHGPNSALEETIKRSGRAKTKSSDHREDQRRPNIADLHFPVGGTRFRPCLEDILQMLIYEFDLVAPARKKVVLQALAAGREGWRRTQLRAAIRDNPIDAVTVLHELGLHCCQDEPIERDSLGHLVDY